jgi:hypothetical protein
MKSKPRAAKVRYKDITGFTDVTADGFFNDAEPKILTVYGLTVVKKDCVHVLYELDESDEPMECEGTVIPKSVVLSIQYFEK